MYYNTVVVLGCDSYNSTVTILSSFFGPYPVVLSSGLTPGALLKDHS